jgi:predicted phosphodiesterase
VFGAVGDSGEVTKGLLDVAREMASYHRDRAKLDFVLLLGDNVYSDGVGRGLATVFEAPFADLLSANVPFYAVLGNHDYGRDESPELQRELVPQYVASWRMPEETLEVVELEGGVSLILLDTNRLARGADEDGDVVRALARSRGPWRIVAGHHPLVNPGRGYNRRLERRVRRVLEQAGTPIHIWLAGHEHNLQAFVSDSGSPSLQVVAGSGSDVREIARPADPSRRFASASLGFARVDVVGGEDPRLVASLFEVGAPPLPAAPRLAARFEVRPAGAVEETFPGS